MTISEELRAKFKDCPDYMQITVCTTKDGKPNKTFTMAVSDLRDILALERGEAPSQPTPAQSKTHREILAEEADRLHCRDLAKQVRDGATYPTLLAALAAMARVSGPLVVTEAAIEAAFRTYFAKLGGIKAMKEALTAALPHMGRKEDTREEMIEECAKVVEAFATCKCGRSDCYSDNIPKACAAAIRALSHKGRKG